jgi:hypothetical protein
MLFCEYRVKIIMPLKFYLQQINYWVNKEIYVSDHLFLQCDCKLTYSGWHGSISLVFLELVSSVGIPDFLPFLFLPSHMFRSCILTVASCPLKVSLSLVKEDPMTNTGFFGTVTSLIEIAD